MGMAAGAFRIWICCEPGPQRSGRCTDPMSPGPEGVFFSTLKILQWKGQAFEGFSDT